MKAAAPRCLPRVTTNGDALTEALLLRLVGAGVVAFYITRHVPPKPGWDERILALRAKYPHLVTVTDIEEIERTVGLWTRAGLVKVKKEFKVDSCRAPEGTLTIDRNGDVLLCCCDYFHKNKQGNVRDSGLLEIWRSARFADVRANLRRGVAVLDICKNCVLRIGRDRDPAPVPPGARGGGRAGDGRGLALWNSLRWRAWDLAARAVLGPWERKPGPKIVAKKL